MSEALPISREITPDEAAQVHFEMWSTGQLPMWTVYWSPLDFPDKAVARLWVVPGREDCPREEILVAGSVEALRERLPPNLTRLPRQPGDEPHIVEVWL